MNINHPPNPFVGICGCPTPAEARSLADEARSGHPILLGHVACLEKGAKPLPKDPSAIFPGEDEAHALNCVRLKSWPGNQLLATLKEIERAVGWHLDAILLDADEWPCADSLKKPEPISRKGCMIILRVSREMLSPAGNEPESVAWLVARYAPNIDHVIVELGEETTAILMAIREDSRLAHIGIGVSGSRTALLGPLGQAALTQLAQRFGPLSVDIAPEPDETFDHPNAVETIATIYEIIWSAKKLPPHPAGVRPTAVA
jgi:hypothetical protein